MRVARLSRIRGYRNFGDYQWPETLPEFGRFNLIYGWNAAGKTTISSLFSHLETKTPVADADVAFKIDDRIVRGSDLASAIIPKVRVFNRDFVMANVLERTTDLSPIFFFGGESVGLELEIEKIRSNLAETEAVLAQLTEEQTAARKALDDFCKGQAVAIKTVVNTTGRSSYNLYDKADFARTAGSVDASAATAWLLDDDRKTTLRLKKDATPKAQLPRLSLGIPDLVNVASETSSLLSATVESRSLVELTADPTLARWVEAGLALHTGTNSTDRCHFCANAISEARLNLLSGHFDDAYRQFQTRVAAEVRNIDALLGILSPVLPDAAKFYADLEGEYQTAAGALGESLEGARTWLRELRDAVAVKATRPFDPMQLDDSVHAAMPIGQGISAAVEGVNAIVQRHNRRTDEFQAEVRAAQETLERALVAEAMPEYIALRNSLDQSGGAVAHAIDGRTKLIGDIEKLQRTALSNRRPAEELTEDLAAYLGRDDLRVEMRDDEAGYRLVRGDHAAENLSEGEKTAFAFLYYLTSLRDQTFRMDRNVVVIDDPVSSLDGNSLFSAFGYMRAQTENAGQLFVLTHNFAFFSQVRTWFRKQLPPQARPARFYLVESVNHDGVRTGTLRDLDPLLSEYQSEYHFLFRKVWDEAHRTGVWQGLEGCYEAPNVARRLVESFLSFKFPGDSRLDEQLSRVTTFPAARKARVIRLLHFGSHAAHLAEPEHDLSLLSESPAVLSDVLDLIKAADPVHFADMEKLVTQ